MAKNKKKKKNKQNKFLKNFLTFIVILAILGVIGYFGFRSYNEITGIVKDVEQFQSEYQFPTEFTDKIDLPTKIGDNITIEWKSSNQSVITNTGNITQPDFEEGEVSVTLTGKIIIEFEEVLSETLIGILGIEIKDIVQSVNVSPLAATDESKVQSVISKLTMIEETYSSIYLPEKLCFESINIEWDSLNDNVMSDDGDVTTPSNDTVITLKATISSNEYSEVLEFKVKVLANEPTLEIVEDNFDNQAPTSRYDTINSPDGVSYYNARIMEEEGASVGENADTNDTVPSFIRLRNKDENNGSFEIKKVINPKTLSFKYKFSGSQKTESSKLVININNNVQELIVTHKEEYQEYLIDLTMYEEVNITVTHIDDWSGETYIDIDDVMLITNVSMDNIESWVINNTPTSVSKAIVLPFTTQYGGEIEWSSDSSYLTKEGIVNRVEEAKTVTLSAKITYLGQTKTITIEVIVKGKGTVQALEVYFIDIGKYGAGDCGESIYIKYGDIDIIVDAGDHFGDTIQAVTEAINQRLEDDVIEYVIATHPDGDHIGGMAALFENFEIKTLIKFEGGYTTQKYKNMETAFKNEGCEVFEIQSDIIDKNLGEKFITLSNDVFINFIDTTYYTATESNGKSIVFVLEAYGTRVLMTGDADNASGHTDLEEKYKNQVGDIDILKVVHHGTANGSEISFLNVVDPEVAIICNGNYLGNKHGHPTPTALSNLYTYDSDMKVYAITGGGTIDGVVNKTNRTYKCSSEDRFNQRNGLITLLIDNNGYSLSSEYYGKNMIEIKDTYYYKAISDNGLL